MRDIHTEKFPKLLLKVGCETVNGKNRFIIIKIKLAVRGIGWNSSYKMGT